MSEYQYYEFQAIDRPLTHQEMDALRSYSTRAHITPTSFVNEYSYGNFKGDEDAWMEQYFDAFLHLANWGTHVLQLRLPSRLLDPATAAQYCHGQSAAVREKAGKVVISFVSEDEGDGEWAEGAGQLSALIPVRAELARGDLRALYLGWLLQAQNGELDDEAVEPPVPPGLGQLSASLQSLAEFVRIEDDLLHVAAQASPALEDFRAQREEVRQWVATLAATDKDELIADLIVDSDPTLVTQWLQQFVKQRSVGAATSTVARRTVDQLLRATETYAEEQRRIAAQEQAEAKARQEREAAVVRQKYLDSLAGRESKIWAQVDALLATKLPKNYDQAVRVLADLRDLDARTPGGDFRRRMEALREAQTRRPAFIERLRKAGL